MKRAHTGSRCLGAGRTGHHRRGAGRRHARSHGTHLHGEYTREKMLAVMTAENRLLELRLARERLEQR